jgi:hypothetical protein
MGCLPYFAVTGSHPLIPLDISEVTYLQPPSDSILSTTDLSAHHVIALQKQSQDLAVLYTPPPSPNRVRTEHSEC